ncbi:hypothetical protein HYH03_017076 [Edaphochlamys debaryana]|uniref:Uncharacterized protein n=1 Tax=Edaphochlamys debaryana TaxID=47281 RepID=A0A835XHY6_9CHLO|nr:hypothetical protein HYH03_017076 [Edaphochlamys debaryana]|eukprot:KAG2484126.1 hypothetical protein HYH03_017076 [Edaphochlamys debaryana]
MADFSYELKLEVVLVGSNAVGKSSILRCYKSDAFRFDEPSTIGVDLTTTYLTAGGKRYKVMIWDTAGQERFRAVATAYYRRKQAALFVYDVTDRKTFEDLERLWMPDYAQHGPEGTVKMLVGNKADLSTSRQVSCEEGHNFARRHGCLFVETSARANTAVGQAFEELLAKVLDTPALLEAAAAPPAACEADSAGFSLLDGMYDKDASCRLLAWTRHLSCFPWPLFLRGG